jgi:DNA transformation protein and related proteins
MAFKQFLEELYAPMGGVTVHAMFGGLGVFKDATMFALAVEDVLYLRADASTEANYAQEQAPQFIYRGMKDREVAMPYWRLPERLYDDPDEFIVWANAAFDAAMRAAAEKAKGKRPANKGDPKKPAPRNARVTQRNSTRTAKPARKR